MSTPEEYETRRKLERLEALIAGIDHLANPDARSHAMQLVEALLDFHGSALTRLLDRIAEASDDGPALIAATAGDQAVSSLLLLYGLHPEDLETRVQRALENVRPYLKSHGGGVALLDINPSGVVRLQMQGSCHGCPSSAMTLKNAIEEAIYAAAPDVTAIEVEGVVAPSNEPMPSQLVTLELGPTLH